MEADEATVRGVVRHDHTSLIHSLCFPFFFFFYLLFLYRPFSQFPPSFPFFVLPPILPSCLLSFLFRFSFHLHYRFIFALSESLPPFLPSFPSSSFLQNFLPATFLPFPLFSLHLHFCLIFVLSIRVSSLLLRPIFPLSFNLPLCLISLLPFLLSCLLLSPLPSFYIPSVYSLFFLCFPFILTPVSSPFRSFHLFLSSCLFPSPSLFLYFLPKPPPCRRPPALPISVPFCERSTLRAGSM